MSPWRRWFRNKQEKPGKDTFEPKVYCGTVSNKTIVRKARVAEKYVFRLAENKDESQPEE